MIKLHRMARSANSGSFKSQGTVEERFWAKVDKAGPVVRTGLGPCWRWTSTTAKHRRNYGLFKLQNGRQVKAHRMAYELTSGPIPGGLMVCHHCDNPPCVNPAHLFLGTCKDNLDDMYAKDRGPTGDRNGSRKHPETGLLRGLAQRGKPHPWCSGERHWARREPHKLKRGTDHPASKLRESEVLQIRALAAQRVLRRELAARFGVNITTINRIVRREDWAHLP